jgi:type VI protein secretion system component Hcp
MSSNTGMSEIRELTDEELDAASGGITFVYGHQFGALTQNIGSASSGAGAGKVSFSELSITKVTDSASPAF